MAASTLKNRGVRLLIKCRAAEQCTQEAKPSLNQMRLKQAGGEAEREPDMRWGEKGKSRWVRQRSRREDHGGPVRVTSLTANGVWRLCMLQLLQALCQQGWKVGIDQTPTVSAPADAGPPLFEILMVKNKGTGQQLLLVPVWHRAAPALDPGGAEPKPTLAQGKIAEVALFGPEMGKPGLLGVRP